MSGKDDFISGHIKEAHEKRLKQMRAYYKVHKEEENVRARKYKEEHPEQVRANDQRASRKGGKRYEKMLTYSRTGIPGGKKKIRRIHARQYKSYKDIIAPESQIHHQWVIDTVEYTGMALVEADQHMHGFVDVIQILEGEITLFTEESLMNRGEEL